MWLVGLFLSSIVKIWLVFGLLVNTKVDKIWYIVNLSNIQCFEIRHGPVVEPVNLLTRNKSDLGFVNNPKFKNTQKPADNFYIFLKFLFMFLDSVLYYKFPIRKLGFF